MTKESNIENIYYSHFDVMKGIAIIFVVIGHVMLFTFQINPSEPSKFIYFNMPMFFYISGYLAYKPINDAGTLVRKILNRGMVLLIPYIVFLSLYKIYCSEGYILESIISGGGRYWFLYDLFIFATFFLVYEYILRIVKNKWLYVLSWILFYVVLVCIKMCIIGLGNDEGWYDVIQGIVNYYRYYLIGYLCRKYVKLDRIIFDNQLIYTLGFLIYFTHWYLYDRHNMILSFLGTMGAIIVIQTFIKKHIKSDCRVCKILTYIGKGSLGVYVIHYFFIPVLPYVKYSITGENLFILQIILALLIAIPIIASSLFIYKAIETNRWLFLILFGKRFKK